MSHGASLDHTTADSTRLAKSDSAGWGYGHTALTFCGVGVIVFAVMFASAQRASLTVGNVIWLALASTLVLGGLQGARWAFGTKRAGRVERTFSEDLAAIQHLVIGLVAKFQEWLDAQKVQAERSREARERLERMERSLIAVDAKLKDAEAFGQHLVALIDRMEALEKRQEEMLNLMVARQEGQPEKSEQAEQATRPVTPRQRKRRRRSGNDDDANVIPMRARRAADALRRLTEHITDDPAGK